MNEADGISAKDIEAKVKRILVEECDRELLSLKAGVAIDMLWIMHPMPGLIVRMVARQRPVEDMILLMSMIGLAANRIREEMPDVQEKDLIDKCAGFGMMLRRESPEFEKFAGSEMKADRKKVVEMGKKIDEFILACAKGSFDASNYLSKHKDLLSLAIDQLLLARVLTMRSDLSASQASEFVEGTWEIRELLALNRKEYAK